MQGMSNEIAYYLCSIMVVLALIIAYGAIRHRSDPEDGQEKQSSEN